MHELHTCHAFEAKVKQVAGPARSEVMLNLKRMVHLCTAPRM